MFKAYIDGVCFYDDIENNESISDLILTLEENKAGSFEFTLYPTNPFFSTFDKLNSIVTVKQHNEIIFRGRVIESNDTFDNERTICCEGELAFFNDSVVYPYGYSDEEGSTTETAISVLTKIINNHNSQVDIKRQFVLGTITISQSDKAVPYAQMDYVKSIDAINSMLETFGGHIMFRHENDLTFIDWTEIYPTINQNVEFGENLLDFTQNIQSDDIITAILPTGDKSDETQLPTNISQMTIKTTELHRQIGEYIINIPLYNKYGVILEHRSYEGFPADWIDKVCEEVDNLSGLENSIEVSALDMGLLNDVDVFSIGKSVQVTSPYHNINGKYNLTKLKLNLQKPEDNTFTFGKIIKNFVEQIIIGNNENKVDNSQNRPKAYEYAYANNDSKIERPDDSEFKVDTLPIEGKIYWVRVTTTFSDGTKNIIYYPQNTSDVESFVIESDTASVIRNDRLTTSQTITLTANISGYPQAKPKWYVDGNFIGEGSPIKIEIPYRNANSISVNLFNGSILMHTLNLPVTDKSGNSMYLGAYDEKVPNEAYDDDGNALIIMKGDYFLCSKNFSNFEAGNPYVWNGHAWELAELSKNVNSQGFGQIMANSLNDALSCDTVENTKFMSWFKRLAVNEGFIRDLLVYALKVGSGNDTDGFIMKIIDGNPPTIVAKYKGQILWEIDANHGKMYGNFARVLQYLPFNFDDSLDASHPFECKFYIPENSEIKSLKLSVKGEKYRAYSTSAVYISDWKLKTGDITWSLTNPIDIKLDVDVTKTNDLTQTGENGSHYHEYQKISGVGGLFGEGEHKHSTSTDSLGNIVVGEGGKHTHTFSTENTKTTSVDNHTHSLPSLVTDVSVTVDTTKSNFSHTHDLDVSHAHDLTFGIYEGTYPTDVKLFIDNGSGYGSSPIELGSGEMLATDLDISEYFSENGWKKMKFTSTTLGRLTVQLIAELYINT